MKSRQAYEQPHTKVAMIEDFTNLHTWSRWKESRIWHFGSSTDTASTRCQMFFFKQKTAYEILRSDWSSDVCSSD
eukprot:COSAG01_NODE_56064_length_321_cov_0.346847_1_plen_74_part_10